MIKCFLSHSSKDKERYVDIVAEKVGFPNCVYDKYVFEEGMKTFDEILKGLKQSDLFVLFISETALNSEWVKDEIINANLMLKENEIKRIYPIIIDEKINYSDERIPDWMRDEYNLKYVSRPTVAARRIRQRLREISWEVHPSLKKRNSIFVGRNSLVSQFEERFDDFDNPKPTTVIANGIPSIGRRSLSEYCIIKTNIKDDSYDPPYIYLNSQDSIEDFILKIYDLGFTSSTLPDQFMKTKIEDKIEIGAKLVSDLHKSKELVFIVDNGCIVNWDRTIREWFIKTNDAIKSTELLTFCVISRFRPNPQLIRTINHTFVIDVPELTINERKGLFNRYSEVEGVELLKSDFEYFSNLLSGYPEQVYFVVHQIKDFGLSEAKKNTHLIVEYNSLKVQHLLSSWAEDECLIDFLRLLAEFEFVSYDLIFEIVSDSEKYKRYIDKFQAAGIIELIGANKENIRVLDNVRDYIKRQRLSLNKEYKEKLDLHIKEFLKTYRSEEKDLSDFLYSMKESLKAGKDLDERFLIPSHFLKVIRELYDQEKKFKEVVRLSDRVLRSSQYLERSYLQHVRYYLCLALARLRDDRCVREAHNFDGAELYFLLGFYYRLKGRYDDAISKLTEALRNRPNFPRARREMVLVLQYIGEYSLAKDYAKANYENDRSNPFHIHAYLTCLLKDIENKAKNKNDILSLLTSLQAIKSENATEMFLTSEAEYHAFHLGNEQRAIGFINDAKSLYPKVVYPKLMEFDIYLRFNNLPGLKKSISEMEDQIKETDYHFRSFIRRKCIYLAKTEGMDKAIALMEVHLATYPETAKESLLRLLELHAI